MSVIRRVMPKFIFAFFSTCVYGSGHLPGRGTIQPSLGVRACHRVPSRAEAMAPEAPPLSLAWPGSEAAAWWLWGLRQVPPSPAAQLPWLPASISGASGEWKRRLTLLQEIEGSSLALGSAVEPGSRSTHAVSVLVLIQALSELLWSFPLSELSLLQVSFAFWRVPLCSLPCRIPIREGGQESWCLNTESSIEKAKLKVLWFCSYTYLLSSMELSR